MRSTLVIVLIMLTFGTHVPPALAEDPMRGPWDSPAYRSSVQSQGLSKNKSSMTAPIFTSLLTFFSKVISPVDGDRCPSYPTCASYSKQAYREHGALVGTLLTVDRLIHEADEHNFSPRIQIHGVPRIYDPLSANEVWTRSK